MSPDLSTPVGQGITLSGLATLVLVRHGETEWNATHRWQGFTGPPLNDLGVKQAEELAANLATAPV
jgi:broad specificity phosphatase PhoE